GRRDPIVLEGSCDRGEQFCLMSPADRYTRFRPPKLDRQIDNVLLQQRRKGALVATYPIKLPSAPERPAGPALDKSQAAWVTQNDEVWQAFTGTGLEKARARLASGVPLRVRNAKDGKAIEVLLSTEITRLARSLDVSIFDGEGKFLGVARVTVR